MQNNTMIDRFVNRFKKDGQDHIRISPFGETKLGKIASKDWRHKFFVPHVGEFGSPVCFANWLSTGDDEARHNPKYRVNHTVKGYLQYIFYAKFYQLCALKGVLEKEAEHLHLPFVAYKQHQSGIKEFDRWKEYPSEVKDMIDHILDPKRGTKTPYNWEEKFPGLEDHIAGVIAAMVGKEESEENSEEPSNETSEITETSAN